MPLTGDFGKLSQLIAQLAGADRIPRELREPLARRALDLVRASYRRGTDPMGRTWKELAAGGPATLYQEGTLFGSLGARITGDGFEIHAEAVHAAIHQYGGNAGRNLASKIPARPYLPDGDAMPYPWQRSFQLVCDEHFARHFE